MLAGNQKALLTDTRKLDTQARADHEYPSSSTANSNLSDLVRETDASSALTRWHSYIAPEAVCVPPHISAPHSCPPPSGAITLHQRRPDENSHNRGTCRRMTGVRERTAHHAALGRDRSPPPLRGDVRLARRPNCRRVSGRRPFRSRSGHVSVADGQGRSSRPPAVANDRPTAAAGCDNTGPPPGIIPGHSGHGCLHPTSCSIT